MRLMLDLNFERTHQFVLPIRYGSNERNGKNPKEHDIFNFLLYGSVVGMPYYEISAFGFYGMYDC